MSYQALARKWRPQSFEEVIGQEHVVSALANALDSERVHHAYLFTGTRGVGKTTLARIFARALNCETGVSASPCGQCAACVGVSQGSYLDLIEVDAASRTRVDDTRELLDNVQYAPTLGRYKIYLIDEVHMLSTHSFNALLKTLEEPPAHVKFLLATTDPQKLPATILSRCIQFNLKAMDVERLYGQLEKILSAEEMTYEPEALKVISRSADGSVRDALSLLDQAIAFGNGRVEATQVRSMLGMIDSDFTRQLLVDVCANNPAQAMQTARSLAERSVDFAAAMDDILTMLHHIALYQVSPDAVIAKGVDAESVAGLVEHCDPELTQLLYQIALIGKRDLSMAPDPRTGFEMALLRMTSFQPHTGAALTPSTGNMQLSQAPSQPAPESVPPLSSRTASGQAASAQSAQRANGGSRIQRDPAVYGHQVSATGNRPTPSAGDPAGRSESPGRPDIVKRKFIERPAVDMPASAEPGPAFNQQENMVHAVDHIDLPMDNPPPLSALPPEIAEESPQRSPALDCSQLQTREGWASYVEHSGIDGISRELAMNMVPKSEQNGVLTLVLDERAQHLFNETRLDKLNQHLSSVAAGEAPRLQVSIEKIDSTGMETPSLQKQRIVAETQEAAEQTFRSDPNVQELVNLFDAEIIEDSVRPATE